MDNVTDIAGPGDVELPGLCGQRGKGDLFWVVSIFFSVLRILESKQNFMLGVYSRAGTMPKVQRSLRLHGDLGMLPALLSYNLSLNTSNPDFTLCFQRSVLLWIPCGWLWLASIFYIIYLMNKPRKHTLWRFSRLNLIKTISSCILCVLTLVDLCYILTSREAIPPVDIMYCSVRFASMLLVLVLNRWEFLIGFHTSGVLFIYWLFQLVCDIFILRSWVMRNQKLEAVGKTEFVTFCIYFIFTSVSFISQFFSDRSAIKSRDIKHKNGESIPLLLENKTSSDYTSKKAMPNLTAPFWKTATFLWVTMDIIRGNIRLVTFDKLYEIRPFDMCRHLVPKFYTIFNKKKSDKPIPLRPGERSRRERNSFVWSLVTSTMSSMIFGMIFCMISLLFRVLQPITLGWLIAWIESGSDNAWQGVVLACALFLFSVTNAVLIHNYLNCNWLAGMRARTVANAVIYRKALRLSGSAKKLTTVGEILNLMSVDGQKIQDMCTFGNLVWEVPIEVAVCLSLIWNVIGPSTLSGLGVLAVLMPVNGFLVAEWIRKLQVKQMIHKDTRVKNINEVLAGMKIIKLYAWEPSFLQRIIDTRSLELYYLKVANIIAAISNIFWFLVPYLVSLAIFATYVLSSPENVLDPSKAFVTMSLINVMNFTLSILPLGVTFVGQGLVSLKRISHFLDMDELEDGVVDRVTNIEESVSVKDASFSWEREGRVVLENINLDILEGQLVAVVGHVGSGKSSLVAAMLGEMVKHSGFIKVKGSMAYVPQQAWIQNANLRDNVLFGKKYQEDRYNSILDTCALLPDLRILTDGDQTEIGEKGINLSGGQKQRVSLARAVYQNEDIYLLDDPLSAVDAHVGKHIFDKVISNKGLLRRKTRILVTHGISFLRQVDMVVVMHGGRISEIGHFDQLVERNGAFAEFLRNYFNDCNEYSSDEEEDIVAIQSQLSAMSGTESEVEGLSSHKTKRPRKRKISRRTSSIVEQKHVSEASPAKLIAEETAEEGNVRLAIIWRFISAGGIIMFVLTVISQLLFTAFQVLTSFWLNAWSSDVPGVNGTMDASLVSLRLGVYGGLGVGQGVFATIMLVSCALGGVAASGNLHSDLIYHIMHAPMSFFDTTPLGRIMNRFSKDLDLIDANMPIYVRGLMFTMGPVLATAFVVSYTTPIFLVVIIPIAIIYVATQRMYIKYVRQLKRIDNIRRSPIYAHFDETINGTSSIRAYERQSEFINKCDVLIDQSQRPFFMILSAQRWLGVTMESVGGFITFFAALFAVFAKDSLSPGSAGLSVSYALNVTILLNSLIRCSTELETYMVSVERVDEYCKIIQEADWRKPETETDHDWPTEGVIKVEKYGTRYRPGLDLVLKNMSCDIQAGEKVGIVGRTGAGKSSLALALFRLIEAAEGSISIDGINISTLGLHNLRSRITIIPQDPVIFSGTLRMNLDPFNEYSDEEVWISITKAHLKNFVESVPEHLEYECGEGGESLSVGQRQLVCLARALLRQTKVLVLDEATAAMDLETDALIQATIKDMFTECTILTIAHRLATVMDYDRIMVLDQGNIIEFDAPSNLIEKTDSVFYSLAKEAGMV